MLLRVLHRNFKFKAALEIQVTRAPLIPKFASEVAAIVCELRNRSPGAHDFPKVVKVGAMEHELRKVGTRPCRYFLSYSGKSGKLLRGGAEVPADMASANMAPANSDREGVRLGFWNAGTPPAEADLFVACRQRCGFHLLRWTRR